MSRIPGLLKSCNNFIITLFFIFISSQLSAQYGSWWEPTYPLAGDTVTIYFDPTQHSTFPNNPSTLTLHWGVNESGTGNWNVPPSYLLPAGSVVSPDSGAVRSPMSIYGGSTWIIKIPTDTSIVSIHYVFNDGTPQNYGSNWANNPPGGGSGANWNIDVFPYRLNVVIISPQVNVLFEDPQRSPVFAATDDTVNIKATALTFDAELDSLVLFVDNTFILADTSDTLSYDFIAANFNNGFNSIKIVGIDTSGFIDSTIFYIMVNPPLTYLSAPAGIEDGINYINNSTVTLSLFAPYKNFAYVLGDFNDWKVDTTYFMNKHEINTDSVRWWITIPGLTPGEEYAFQYLVDGEIRIADPYAEKVLDSWNDPWISSATYPNLKPYPDGKTVEPVAVLQTDQIPFTWVYSDTFVRPEQHNLVIYELLVRDFIANHDYSTLEDTLDYLQNLGINAIELMPVNEFEGNSSWGYNPSFYFAADKYYGPAEDLKCFIDECHARGIAVIMDIVLNHSFGQSPLVRLYWDAVNHRPAANNPWYNVQSPNPVFAWGYDFNHESEATKIFIDRVNKYWLTEYRFDGFRFDFTKGFTNTPGDGGNYDQARINILKRMSDKIWEVDSTAYVILEHFAENSEEKILAQYRNGMMLWGNSNYNYNEATMGYHDGGKSDFSWGYYGSRGWSKPNLVTYMESHDEERLMYKNVTYGKVSGNYSIRDTSTALNRIKMAGAFFFTYPGPKMIWQFEELGYDVTIDFNGRVGEKPIRWFYFDRIERNYLYKTFAALLKLRRENEVFTSPQTTVSLWLSDTNGRKRIKLTHPTMNVVIIGNFDVQERYIDPSFHQPGKWYDYFSGDSINVINPSSNIHLLPGEFHIYTDQRLDPPEPGILNDVETEKISSIIKSFELSQNYPNPFNPVTTIQYSLPKNTHVQLEIFNIAGEKVVTLVNKNQQPGIYKIQWDGRNGSGKQVSTGEYFFRIKAGEYIKNRKMILLR